MICLKNLVTTNTVIQKKCKVRIQVKIITAVKQLLLKLLVASVFFVDYIKIRTTGFAAF